LGWEILHNQPPSFFADNLIRFWRTATGPVTLDVLSKTAAPGGPTNVQSPRMLGWTAGACLLTFVAAAPAVEKIKWAKSLDAALKEAKSSGKLVMADFYTDWCHWCKKLDQDVYADAKFAKLAGEQLVSVKVNAESPSGGKAAAKKYNISSYPNILFLNGDGKVVDRIGGYMPVELFSKKVTAVAHMYNENPDHVAKDEKGSPSGDGLIPWAKSFEDVLSAATKAKKPAMIDFYTNSSDRCKKLDSDVYSDTRAAKIINKNVVSLKLDAESDEGTPLAAKYNVKVFPTIVFVDGKGKMIGKIVDYLAAEPFAKRVEDIVKGQKDFPKLLAALKSKAYDPDPPVRLAAIFAGRGELDRAQGVLNEAEGKVADQSVLATGYNEVGDALQSEGKFAEAIPLFRKAAELGDAGAKVYALSSIGACLEAQGKFAEAVKEVDKALRVTGAPEKVRKDAEALKVKLKHKAGASAKKSGDE
jgi:thioredoxin-related protein